MIGERDETGPDTAVRRLAEAARADGAGAPGVLLALAEALDRRLARVVVPASFADLRRMAGDRGRGAPRPLPPAVADAVEVLAASPGTGAEVLGVVHERLLDRGDRHRRGAFYTPRPVAEGLVAEVVDRLPAPAGDGTVPVTICDPAAGGGVFLLAAAAALHERGVPARTVVERSLWGCDVDPLASAVTAAALELWCRARGEAVGTTNVVAADLLEAGATAWPAGPAGGFDAIVGNPPFQNQLGGATARSAAVTAAQRARWGEAVYRYTDTAAVFLLAATELTAPEGVVALIVPLPVLVGDDARRVRAELLDRARPEHLWLAGADVFDAGVRVCAPVLRRRHDTGHETGGATGAVTVSRSLGPGFAALPDRPVELGGLRAAGTWGELVADAFGVPPRAGRGAGRLGDFAAATAGFRDQFYGLRPFVVEAPSAAAGAPVGAGGAPDDQPHPGGPPDPGDQPHPGDPPDPGDQPHPGDPPDPGDPTDPDPRDADDADSADRVGTADPAGGAPDRWPRLVTSGLVDPARCLWGRRSTRFDRRWWEAPVVDRERLSAEDPALAAWADARLVPKVVVATQTRVLEAAVDVHGAWFPSVPTIALTCDPDRLWDAAAVVLAPSTSVWAMNRHVGAALSADALKVSARQLLEAPLPADAGAWRDGAGLLRVAAAAADEEAWRAALEEFGAAMARAYAAADDELAWWRDRLPRWR